MPETQPLDTPLLDLTDASLARPLQPALVRARADALAAAEAILRIPEAAFARPWTWIGGGEDEIRFGAYHAAEILEVAELEARAFVSGADRDETHAARKMGPATAAAWDLLGLLFPLAEDRFDADPGGGEWTVRQTMGHVITGQRAYAWSTAWWAANPHYPGDPDLPRAVPDSLFATLPDEMTEAHGTNATVRADLREILDLSAERLAGSPDDRLELPARWAGFPVTVGFRIGRWSSHLREHTIQVEKTLAMLDDVPSEGERLARQLLAAYGRAESAVFGRGSSDAVTSAAERIASGAAEALETVQRARAAAGS